MVCEGEEGVVRGGLRGEAGRSECVRRAGCDCDILFSTADS